MLSVTLCTQCHAIPPVPWITNTLNYKLTQKKPFKVQSLSQFCSKSYCSCPPLFSASIRLKQKGRKPRLQFCYFFLMVNIFQSVYGLSHFPTPVLEKPISPSTCSQGLPLLLPQFLPPHSAHQPNSEKDDCLSQLSHLYFSNTVGLERKGCTHT